METAYAKINLALHVRDKRADGYHELETIFAFAEHGDLLSAEIADTLSLSIDGPFCAELDCGDTNLIIRAAKAVQVAMKTTQGAQLYLTKNLPIASGIGGGSADAAATLRLLIRLWKLDISQEALENIALQLGSDVPACVKSESAIGMGRGEELETVPFAFTGISILLVNPRIPVSTAAIFHAWDGVDKGALDCNHHPIEQGLLQSAIDGRNDLSGPAILLAPQINDVLTSLASQSGVILSRMSGSGATCFALFDNAADCEHAHAAIQSAHPDWWIMTSKLR